MATRSSVDLEAAFERLRELAELGPDWDSYGGLPPSPEALATAQRLLVEVGERFGHLPDKRSVPAAVVPLADGRVQLEWRGPRTHLEVEIRSTDDLAYLFVSERGAERTSEEADAASWAGVIDLVARALGA